MNKRWKKLMTASWKETEKEHKNYVAERIKRRNKKLNEAYSSNDKYMHQWIRQDYQTPIATMKGTDGSITMNFQEIHQTLVEAWRPIFARWDGREEPRYSDFEECFGRFIPKEPMNTKKVTGVELCDTAQRWSNNAAAGSDSWKRCGWKQFKDTMYDQVAEYLNTIEETACEMSYTELKTSIWPEDIRTTPVANIKKKAESPGPRYVRPSTLAATLCCVLSST